jgi:hypothetical protein
MSRVLAPNVTIPLSTVLAAYAAVWSGYAPLPTQPASAATAVTAEEFRQVKEKVDQVNTKVERLDAKAEEHGKQLDRIETRINSRYGNRHAPGLGAEGG